LNDGLRAKIFHSVVACDGPNLMNNKNNYKQFLVVPGGDGNYS
jgi:hypothetical protein